jgi:uncharacterized ferredoxin-like protein
VWAGQETQGRSAKTQHGKAASTAPTDKGLDKVSSTMVRNMEQNPVANHMGTTCLASLGKVPWYSG